MGDYGRPNGKKGAFDHYARLWMESVSLRLKDSSCVKYRNVIYRRLLPALGSFRIDKIDLETVQRFLQELVAPQQGRALSGSTIKTVVSTLRRILDFARVDLDLPPLAYKNLLPIANGRSAHVDILTKTEVQRLLCYLTERYQENLALVGVYLPIVTGMRIGEVCGLQWGDVDFAANSLIITRTVRRLQTFSSKGPRTAVRISTPKTQSSRRTVPLSQKTRSLLASIRVDRPTAFVLTGTEKPLEPRTLENVFRRVLAECGIRRVRFHDLRHFFATLYVTSGFDVKSLSEILGHSSVNITLDIYSHSSNELKIRYLDALDRKLS